MRKLFVLSILIIVFLTTSLTAFAGDVPEGLLYEDNAKVFLGTVANYTTKDIPSAPYTIIDTVEVIPTEKIKGNVEIGVKETYSRCHSSLELKSDTEYLFGYFDENNFYIYEIESRNDGQFKLVGSDDYDMTMRFEEYLNDGLYADAEKERSTIGLEVTLSEYMEADIDIAEKVTFNIGGNRYEIDKDAVFKLADEIKVKNVKDDALRQADNGENSWQENMIFITVDLKEGYTVYKSNLPSAIAAISKYGEVSHNALEMSLLPSKDYQMEFEDVAKLYKLLPLEVSEKYVEPTVEEKTELNNRTNIIVGATVSTLVVIGLIGYFVFKKKVRR